MSPRRSALKWFRLIIIIAFLQVMTWPSPATVSAQTLPYHGVLSLGRGIPRHLDWSPDGRLLAVGTSVGVWIYSDTLDDVRQLDTQYPVTSVVWSPDGSRLAVGVADWDVHAILIWDSATWSVVTTLPDMTTSYMVWSPDGTKIAAAVSEIGVAIWDVTTTKHLVTLANERPVRAISWSKDGKELLVAGIERGSSDFEVIAWDTASGQRLKRQVSNSGTLNEAPLVAPAAPEQEGLGSFLQFVFDNTRLWMVLIGATMLALFVGIILTIRARGLRRLRKIIQVIGLTIGIVVVIVVGAGSMLMVMVYAIANFPSQGDVSTVTAKFSPDGAQIAVGGWYGSVAVWDLSSRKPVAAIGREENATNSDLGIIEDLAWSPQGDQLAIACFHGTRLWQKATNALETLPTDQEIENMYGGANVAWSADGSRIGTIFWKIEDDPSRLLTWDASSRQIMGELPEYKRAMSLAAWSPQGNMIATHGDEKTFIWDAATGELLRILDTKDAATLAWKTDSTGVVILGYQAGSQLETWDLQTGRQSSVVRINPADYIRVSAWSLDGAHIAGAADDFAVRIWDTNGQPIHAMTGHTDWVEALAWSHDGKYLASASEDGSVRIWDTSTGTQIALLAGYHSVAWSPDGQQIVSMGSGDRLIVWNVSTQKMVYESKAEEGDLDWSPDGTKILLGGGGLIGVRATHILDAVTGKELFAYNNAPGNLHWSPDGVRFAVSEWGTVNIWTPD